MLKLNKINMNSLQGLDLRFICDDNNVDEEDDIVKKHCVNCGMQFELLFKCSSCKAAMYCSRVCQKSDWGRHKGICRIASNICTKKNEFSELIRHQVAEFINKNQNVTNLDNKSKGKLCEIVTALKLLAKNGDCKSQEQVGTMYWEGYYIIKPNLYTAKKYIKSAAFGNDSLSAINNLGCIYMIMKEYDKAKKMFKMAVKRNHEGARENLIKLKRKIKKIKKSK